MTHRTAGADTPETVAPSPETNTWKQHEGENTRRSDAGNGTTVITSNQAGGGKTSTGTRGNFSTDQRETVRGDGMHEPGGGEVRNQRQTPTAANWHNTQTTRGSYTGSTRQGKLETNSGAGAVRDG